MARIPSPNPDFDQIPVPGGAVYPHPLDKRSSGARPIAMAFQITSPFSRHKSLLPHALVLHVNPMSIQETGNQKIERFQTRGGFVEQHWGHELVEISADASTGAFMNIRTGLTSVLRQRTIAWDRFRDLHDLFRNNGAVYDPFGNIVLQGHVMLMYDRGVYIGGFRSFEWEETEESPFAFKLSWSYKVEHQVMSINSAFSPTLGAPEFQGLNTQGTAANQTAEAQNQGVAQVILEAQEANTTGGSV